MALAETVTDRVGFSKLRILVRLLNPEIVQPPLAEPRLTLRMNAGISREQSAVVVMGSAIGRSALTSLARLYARCGLCIVVSEAVVS
jgi:hypothetical protein